MSVYGVDPLLHESLNLPYLDFSRHGTISDIRCAWHPVQPSPHQIISHRSRLTKGFFDSIEDSSPICARVHAVRQ
jgi:hypothetical protein